MLCLLAPAHGQNPPLPKSANPGTADPVQPPSPSQAKASKPGTFLLGRIEQIVGSNQLSDIVLRKQTPKLDTRKLLKTGADVASLPEYLIGRWGGDLKNVWSVTAPGITNNLPQYRVNNIGTVVMHFDKMGGRVQLLPTVIFFPIEELPVNQSVINTTSIEADSVDSVKRQIRQTGVMRGVPTLPLAKFDGEGITGSKFQSRVLYDSVRVLKPGVVEHDVLVGEWKEGEFYNYREFVSRFTWYGPKRIYAQLLIANFGVSRQAISKTLLEGWMDSNWAPVASRIAARLDRTWEEVVRQDGIQ